MCISTVVAEGIFEWRASQFGRGPEAAGPLFRAEGPYFSGLSGFHQRYILGEKPIWWWANQFARAPESAWLFGSRGFPIFLTCPISNSGILGIMLFLAFSTQFFLGAKMLPRTGWAGIEQIPDTIVKLWLSYAWAADEGGRRGSCLPVMGLRGQTYHFAPRTLEGAPIGRGWPLSWRHRSSPFNCISMGQANDITFRIISET